MQENNFLLCLRNPCENTFFLKLPIFFVYKKTFKTCQGVGRMQHTRKHFFYIFFCQNTNIIIRRKHQNEKQQAMIHITRTTRNLKQFVTKNRSKPNQLKMLYTGKD